MHRPHVRSLVAAVVLIVTVVAAVYFVRTNPSVGRQLAETSVSLLVTLLALYLLFMISLWLIFRASLVLCHTTLPKSETMLVTAYSSIINFFGPLQSGPAFRGLYLYKRHKVSIKKYALASLVYYFFYAFFSGVLLISGLIGWWSVLAGVTGLAAIAALSRLPHPKIKQLTQLNRRGIVMTAAATALQVSILVIIFYIELHSVDPTVTIAQALTYTGAANFALFVSVTPGAIGFRESFVLLTQQLHNIPSTTVVTASLLDRGAYVAMLLLLAVGIFGSHARDTIRKLTRY